MPGSNPNFLNGVPEMLVLKMLSRRPMYGYELVKAIQEQSQEHFAFGEGCVYPVLHYLEQHKRVTRQRRTVGGRDRQYYQLTARGQKQLEELSGEWGRVVKAVGLVLGGQHE